MKEPITAHMMCMFCPRRAWGGRLGSWLVSDEGWAAAGLKPTDVACWKCYQKRLEESKLRAYVERMGGASGPDFEELTAADRRRVTRQMLKEEIEDEFGLSGPKVKAMQKAFEKLIGAH